jgi:hypothetical protein
VNIQQQIGGSIGTAVMSVMLTSRLNGSEPILGMTNPRTGEPVTEAGAAIASHTTTLPVPPDIIQRGLQFVADSYATTFWVGFVLVLCTFIPIAFLPKKKEAAKTAEPGSNSTKLPPCCTDSTASRVPHRPAGAGLICVRGHCGEPGPRRIRSDAGVATLWGVKR